MNESNALVLGIDTGGTYTDGILLEYQSRRILTTHKSLTTKRDLSIGIEEVINGIQIEDPFAIKMVSISTTLATNSIAEGKSKRVALLLIGYDPELIAAFQMQTRFSTPHFFYVTGGHDLYGREKDPLDLDNLVDKVKSIKDQVDAIAVSGYFSPLNPEHEDRARSAVTEICELPIVLGHQLSTKLGSVERATTAALNASLLAVIHEFVDAVRRAMKRRQIDAPLMVVRGDGTLMSDEFASRTPVETIHSGPAASAIGGRFLSELEDALVVDIGGTTTDIAHVEKGQVEITEDGATVSGYKTAVEAANLFTTALGGDSHITSNSDGEVMVGPERVIPLAYLASQYPRIEEQLVVLSKRSRSRANPDGLQYWLLLREPMAEDSFKKQHEKALVNLLRQGPQPVPAILEHLDIWHIGQMDAKGLLQQEIIAKAGLTPTDLLHVEGLFDPWNGEASRLALQAFCRFYSLNTHEFIQKVWAKMKEAMARAIVHFLTGKGVHPNGSFPMDLDQWFFHSSLYNIHPHLETSFKLNLPIIGVGAPADIFLKDVAEFFQTELILPGHHEVANAVGAVAGAIMFVEEALVYPRMSEGGFDIIGYYVHASNGRKEFAEISEAMAHARAISRETALDAAIRSGAHEPNVILEEREDGLDTFRIRAKAVGNPRLKK